MFSDSTCACACVCVRGFCCCLFSSASFFFLLKLLYVNSCVVLLETFLFCPHTYTHTHTHTHNFSASFYTAHCALDLAREHTP